MSADPAIEVLQQEVKVRLQVIEDLKRDNLRQQKIIQRASSVTAQLRDESTIMNAQLYSLVKWLEVYVVAYRLYYIFLP